jgi:hypothetical protein
LSILSAANAYTHMLPFLSFWHRCSVRHNACYPQVLISRRLNANNPLRPSLAVLAKSPVLTLLCSIILNIILFLRMLVLNILQATSHNLSASFCLQS